MEQKHTSTIPVDIHALENLAGQSVLVTGAGGSIGSQLCQILAGRVAKLTLVSISESALYRVMQQLKGAKCELVYCLGDVANARMMGPLLVGVDIVVHAAAHKHVPICEQNPLTAIENNVTGTRKLMYSCSTAGVKQFIQISTDKAVNPTSIMGATKRCCEMLALRQDWHGMQTSVVRFGNVLGSDGSVVPLWREQIRKGGPLTITDPACTRFFMDIGDACKLIINVIFMSKPGLYVFDMGEAISIGVLAQKMIVTSGTDVKIEVVGLRPGEKLHEELMYGGTTHTTKHPRIKLVVEEQKSRGHYLIPDLEEHTSRRREKEALETLWKIVRSDL